MSFVKRTTSALALAAVSATAAIARDQIQIAGSSTVLPYASIVAEAFGENFDFPTPIVESGGSSAGLKRFCEGVGENTIDIANASRQIKENELKACAKAGVSDIIENNVSGIVCSKEVKDYSENLLRLIEDDDLRLKLAKNGKSISLENYNFMFTRDVCIGPHTLKIIEFNIYILYQYINSVLK